MVTTPRETVRNHQAAALCSFHEVMSVSAPRVTPLHLPPDPTKSVQLPDQLKHSVLPSSPPAKAPGPEHRSRQRPLNRNVRQSHLHSAPPQQHTQPGGQLCPSAATMLTPGPPALSSAARWRTSPPRDHGSTQPAEPAAQDILCGCARCFPPSAPHHRTSA